MFVGILTTTLTKPASLPFLVTLFLVSGRGFSWRHRCVALLYYWVVKLSGGATTIRFLQ